MKRRSKDQLQEAIRRAKNNRARAIAHYNLALFHDNNARETEAIPHYLTALHLGLTKEMKSHALAWLASSLYKIGKPQEALQKARQAGRIANQSLQKFLLGLERRIQTK